MTRRHPPQPMPLYRKLRAGLAEEQTEHHIRFELFEQLIPFNVQAAADIFWCGDQDWYNYSDVGPMRLPFPAIWMEWTIPTNSKIRGKQLSPDHHLLGLRCGAVVTTDFQIVHPSDPYVHNTGGGYDYTLFTEDHAKLPMLWPAIGRVECDDDGTYERHSYLIPDRFALDTDEKMRLKESVGMLTTPLVIALGLINCRNVQTQDSGELVIPRKKPKTRGRRYDTGPSSDRVRYNTIVLPGGYTGSTDTRTGAAGTVAQHLVRGHTKTFTAEKPLLGKHVGTYWWGHMVRGNPERGTVVSDYSLGDTGS